MSLIKFPSSCSELDIFQFCEDVESSPSTEDLTIDFTNMGRIEPFTMLYVAKIIRDYIKRHSKQIFCVGHKEKSYPANMGFFRAFGLKHGREPNCVDGNDRFVPFTILRIQTIKDEATKEWQVEQEIIERRAEKLAQILSQEESSNLVDALTFSIREIMRNVFEHSQSKSIEYCAQYWPSYHRVEIAIIDNGIGLKESLQNNPFIEIKCHSDAIQQALMPAISSKSYQGAPIDRNDPWHNSGFGLYMINRICRLGGSFLICSGNHGIKLDENGKEHIDLNHECKGTAVKIHLDTSKLTKLADMLTKFREEGYEIAKEIKGVGMYTASSASQMLSRDFNKNT